MLYVIGEYELQAEFVSKLVRSLEGGKKVGEKEECLPENARINTRYYSAEIGVKFWKLREYLESEDLKHCPEAILLILSGSNLAADDFQSNTGKLLSVLDKRYPPLSNTDITRLCCVFQNQEESMGPSLRDKLSNKCSQSSFELMIIITSDTLGTGSSCPPTPHSLRHQEDDDLVFSFNGGVERVTQALYCTNWSTMHKPQESTPDPEQDKNLESCLDNFELLSSIMRRMTHDTKHLTDYERRKRASNLIYDIVRHLDLDDS